MDQRLEELQSQSEGKAAKGELLSPDGLPILRGKDDIVVEPDDESTREINERLRRLREENIPHEEIIPIDELLEFDPRIPGESSKGKKTLLDVMRETPGESGILLERNPLDKLPLPPPSSRKLPIPTGRRLPTPPLKKPTTISTMEYKPNIPPRPQVHVQGIGCFGLTVSRRD